MADRSIVYGSFTVTRSWKAAPSRVFEAFASEEAKRKWFASPAAWEGEDRLFDFREGGREMLKGKHGNGTVSQFDCLYRDIVAPTADQGGRIIYSYVMHLDGRKISVSQACITLTPDKGGTKLVVHEDGIFLDGYNHAGSREHGTNFLIDALGASLGG